MLCCIPASMGFLRTKLNPSSCYALSTAQTHSLAVAIPAPGAPPAELLALLPSPSYPSRKSSPHCCDCSLCFCSPLVLLAEAEAGPLQAHQASLRTSSQRHPTKRREKLVTKGSSATKTSLWPFRHTRHPTMGQGLTALHKVLYK